MDVGGGWSYSQMRKELIYLSNKKNEGQKKKKKNTDLYRMGLKGEKGDKSYKSSKEVVLAHYAGGGRFLWLKFFIKGWKCRVIASLQDTGYT